MEQKYTLVQAIWLNHYQLVAIEKEDTGWNHPIYGSCFCLFYNKKKYIVTADHVIHYADHFEQNPNEARSNQEYDYYLINNKNDNTSGISTLFTSVSGLFFFDNIKLDDLSQFTIDEIKEVGASIYDFIKKVDLAVARVDKFPDDCLTHRLSAVDDKEKILCKEGEKKLAIRDGSYSLNPQKSDKFYIFGVIKTDIKGIKLDRTNVMYEMTLNSFNDSIIKLKCPFSVKYENWQQLSGSAVFDSKGMAIGMAISVDVENDILNVLPMSYILKCIDFLEDNRCN